MNTQVISGWDGSVARSGYILSERTAKQRKMTFPFKSSGEKKIYKKKFKIETFLKFYSEKDLPTAFNFSKSADT